MSTFFRLLKIFNTVGRYRLDTLLDNTAVPTKYKILLLPFKLFPKHTLERGQRLRFALEELGPIFVKFGQLLSTRPDLVAEDIASELDHLQDNVKPFDPERFQQIVEKALGSTVDELFLEFDHTPLASASIAQVHAAILPNKEEVIVKVARPGIEKTIEDDIQLLLLIAKLVERISLDGQRLKPVEIVDDYRNTIFDELDLAREAANASQLRRNFENSNQLYIPKIHWDYTKQNILVMERIYGIPVTDIDTLEQQNTDMKLLAERGVEIFFTQVFDHNFFHADMHPGNVFIAKDTPNDPSYIAVDMAIMGSLTREDQYYLARNLLAMFRRDYRQVAELHVLSGWVPKGTSISGFESAIRAVCEPIFEKPLKEISFGEALITIFKTARRYNMPVQPQLVLLQKTLLNIEGLGRQIYPDLNLWDTAHPFLEKWIKRRFHPKTLLDELRYHAPEWLEKFPQMPHLLLDSLKEVKQLSESTQQIAAVHQEKQHGKLRSYALKIAGLTLLATSIFSAWQTKEVPPPESMLAIAVGLLLVVLY